MRVLLRRCLQKDAKLRLHDIADARIEIEETLRGTPEARAVREPPLQKNWVRALAWAVAVAFAIVAAIAGVAWWRATRSVPLPPHPLVQLSANLPPGAGVWENGNQVALSPDGTRIAVSMRDAAGKYRLATRRLDQSQFLPLSGTEGAWTPFFSPDGQIYRILHIP